jgi:hypothetical protein
MHNLGAKHSRRLTSNYFLLHVGGEITGLLSEAWGSQEESLPGINLDVADVSSGMGSVDDPNSSRQVTCHRRLAAVGVVQREVATGAAGKLQRETGSLRVTELQREDGEGQSE